MLAELLVYDDLESKPAALNMAVDEALLISATAPILRFYRWSRPSVSFGYFGRYAEVENQTARRDVVRRWTGGGIVLHGNDLTYSILVPRTHLSFLRSSLEVYGAVHEAMRWALETNLITATLAERAVPKVSENCFANPVRADVLIGDRKIAGAAHRRSRFGLLHQGSIQHPDLPEKFRNDFARSLCERFEKNAIDPALLERAEDIAAAKYGSDAWLRRR
jgi:lipoate-protein ligase A